nr:MAG: hypothetical protein KatS3mg041_1655 [Bacteroidota bacterium]
MMHVLLWLMPVAFILILEPTVRIVRVGNRSRLYLLCLLLNTTFLILIAWLWVGIILETNILFSRDSQLRLRR